MKDIELFQLALGISSPWFFKSLELDPVAKRLDIHLDFQKRSQFTCPECGAEGWKLHDTATKTWRHLNFFQYEAYLTARVPRIHCDACGVHLVPVPWAREDSGFTLLFRGVGTLPGSSYAHQDLGEGAEHARHTPLARDQALHGTGP